MTEAASVGQALYDFCAELYPLCRSITGDGLRQTLRHLGRHLPMTISEVPSGTSVLDWSVPLEWNIRDAYIKNARGERVVDFRAHNLHVMSYSAPVQARLSLAELRPRLYSLPDQPEVIPYRTSYYKEDWAFCLSHNQLLALEEGEYEVCVDSTLAPGALSYGECYVRGDLEDEVLISTHACHPSLANDNLSGLAVTAFLAKRVLAQPRHYSYRFLFIPGTIGAITWLARNEAVLPRIKHGLVITGVGDPGALTYKKSRRGNAEVDRAAHFVLKSSGAKHSVQEFFPYGYDERQYGSPGFNLPVGCLMRTPFGRYPQYHTSADNLDFILPEALADSYDKLWAIFDVLEHNRRYLNLYPKGEPQLGRRGLYSSLGGQSDTKTLQLALLWVLNFSDGEHDLLEIAGRGDLSFAVVQRAAAALLQAGLLQEVA